MSSLLPQPITLLVNGKSRRGREQFPVAVEALRAAGVPLGQTQMVNSREETAGLLRHEIEAGAKTVIVGGGDGTLSTTADFLVGTGVAMAVLPLGTGNTFVRSVGIPLNLEEAARTIANGHVEAVDVGRVNDQIFLNSVSIGLSAEIASALDRETKKRLGLLSWPVVGLKVLWTHRPQVLKVIAAEQTYHVRTHQLVVVNGRYVAGPITAAPESSVQDQRLDVFVLGGAEHHSLISDTWRWLRGKHVYSESARYFTTRSLRVEALREPLRANVDGEVNETTPLQMEVLPGALKVVVPTGFNAKQA